MYIKRNIDDIIRVTCIVQPEHLQNATTMLSGAVENTSASKSLCTTILKSIASFFYRTQPPTLVSSATSSESIFLACADTKLIPSTNNIHDNNVNHTQHMTQHCTFHSQSSLSLFLTTQPSSTFSFYSCSSCTSPLMPSACSSPLCASTLAPLPFYVSPNTLNHSSAVQLCINVNPDDSRVYRRLLVQLEETERRFDDFWHTHLIRLKQCLDLRRFEQDFRELQV